MRRDIAFKTSDGLTLRGWFYAAEGANGTAPTIVMCHGYSAVKENYLDTFAEVFAAAGLAALVYDNRCLGESDGEPRQEIDPWAQVNDFRDAITFAQSLPEVDANRIGIWGSSYSGAHVLVVGAVDRRVKCVVSQVPLISGHRNARRLIRADMIAAVQGMCAADRADRYAGKAPQMIAVVSNDPAVPCALPTPDSYEWFTETAKLRAPNWRNEVTLKSIEMFLDYEPGAYLEFISPTPAKLILAAGDHLTVVDEALAAYNRMLEPKSLTLLSGGHFDAYVKDFEASSGAARDWFVEHLGARRATLART
jgi:fermentation-respiration switch protein FrsA (DUF1100 family)